MLSNGGEGATLTKTPHTGEVTTKSHTGSYNLHLL